MKNLTVSIWIVLVILTIDSAVAGNKESREGSSTQKVMAPTLRYVRQGFNMKLAINNRGIIGRQAYPGGGTDGTVAPPDSIGLEYPAGQKIEHVFGGGLWIGGLLDTISDPNVHGPQRRAVTTVYEGWAGYDETYPGETPADTLWKINGRDAPKPPGWDAYWGPIPYRPVSDNDIYCQYTDYGPASRSKPGHIPLRLKILQRSYAWNDPIAQAIIIFEYKIINMGTKTIDSAYVASFLEADVGPITVPNYAQRNFTGYYPGKQIAYVHNPVDRGSTPVGAALLNTSRGIDSLRYTFQWFPGNTTPADDGGKYALMSSGIEKPDEYPQLSDTRFVFAFGPFTIRPAQGPTPDTLNIAIAIVSGYSRTVDPRFDLQKNASRALDIYKNQGIRLPATPPSPPLRLTAGDRRVTIDWKWRPGDDNKDPSLDSRIYGRPNPEANWDTTSRKARQDPLRYQAPHPIGHDPETDTTRGGRNFEAYRLWRSENPNYPDDSFTLVKQFDVKVPDGYPDSLSYQYNTGLEYAYIDSNLDRGKTYVYSVTSVSIPNIALVRQPDGTTVEVEVEPLESSLRVNATRIDLPFATSRDVGRVAVVPNPYRTDNNYTLEFGGWEGLTTGWDERRRLVKFINLPEVCTIRIFSLSGDLVRTVYHDGRSGTFPVGDHNVSLVSESNRALASGIYIFTVESDLGVQTGKFVIIR